MIAWLWQLPQVVLGCALVRISSAGFDHRYKRARVYRTERWRIGISLGPIIILHPAYDWGRAVAHEYGHTRQSMLLGPLYLLLVGLPSITMNILTRAGVLSAARYYQRWPESWADRLGGVSMRR